MSGTINISGLTLVEDPSYRYKMPRIQAKVEGRGNGIKTVLVNIIDVSQSLNREAPEITKFFGCELGSQTTYANDTDRAVVNGAHKAPDLQAALSRYIENFVLCKQCKLPETHYKIKTGIVSQKCLACGHKDAVDMTHKLTTFILAQHKKAKEAAAKSGEKVDKKERKEKKDKKIGGGEDSSTPIPTTEKKSKKDKSATDTNEAIANGDADSDESPRKLSTKKKKSVSDKNGAGGADEEGDGVERADDDDESDQKALEESIDRFRLWLMDNADLPALNVIDELRIVQTFASLRVHDRVIIYLGAVFPEAFISGNEIARRKEILGLLAPNQIQQRHLIAGFEWLCGYKHSSQLKLFPVALKQLFDEELVEEEVFFAWNADLSRNEHSPDAASVPIEVLEVLRQSAAPFMTWLAEADEDEDEEDEG